MPAYSLGIDCGTNPVRALIVDVPNGHELGRRVVDYPSGKHDILLDPCDHNVAHPHPVTKHPVL